MAPAAFARELRGGGPAGRGRAGADAALLRPEVPRALPRRGSRPAVRDRACAGVPRAGRRPPRRRHERRARRRRLRRARRHDRTSTQLERAARAVIAGARLLTGSYVPAYAGAHGPILSRGAMITAAIAKASGARPVVVGKPSQAAVREMERRLGVPSEEIAVVGDDVRLDVALGRLGRSTTVLVRSGISARRRPRRACPETQPPAPLRSRPSRSCSHGCDARRRRSSSRAGRRSCT